MTGLFTPFPKISRLNRDMVVTEKIDGTNAAVIIDQGSVYAQSRKRIITPEDDNFGFSRWVAEHSDALIEALGDGVHFGEWWGNGIQRGYGLPNGDKRFSLFNVHRWEGLETDIPGLGVVPVLYRGPFESISTRVELKILRDMGSVAAPGFMTPEGIVVFHTASSTMFKVTIVGDEKPKGSTE